MNYIQKLALPLALAVIACSKPPPPAPEQAMKDSSAGNSASASNNDNDPLKGKSPEQALDDAIKMSLETVYFDFDSFVVKAVAFENLKTIAAAIKADSKLRVQVEGHADARGSNEYNLALSQKRSEAIRDFLVAEGAKKESVVIMAYGEESPVAEGATEEAFSQNRRAEFKKLSAP